MAIEISGYSFEGPYTSMAYLKHLQGVYTILDKRWDGKWHVIDVGESEDVKDRVENHDRKPCWERNRQGELGVGVLYTPGWSAEGRRSLEVRIRAAFSPACGVR
jgi:DNA-binding transcriptional regulator PaaX